MINWATGGRNWGLAGAVALKYDAGGEPRYLKLENGMIAQLQESHCISPLRQCVWMMFDDYTLGNDKKIKNKKRKMLASFSTSKNQILK